MEIIALSGYARSGKDEAAKALVEEHGFVQVAFADKLREVLYALDPWVVAYNNDTGQNECRILHGVIDEFGWDGYKETRFSLEIRRLLQRLGTEAGRKTLWDSIWIDAAFANLNEDAKVVVSDARFINEFEAVRKRGGTIWRVERPGVGPANDHPSETEAVDYEYFDAELVNDGTLEEWKTLVSMMYRMGL